MEKELKKLLYSYGTLSSLERLTLREDILNLYKGKKTSIIVQTVIITVFAMCMLRIIFGPI